MTWRGLLLILIVIAMMPLMAVLAVVGFAGMMVMGAVLVGGKVYESVAGGK